jgi:hypothetical protein
MIVTTSADGRIEAKAKFTLVPPGSEVAMTSPLTSTAAAKAYAELEHQLILPMISFSGAKDAATGANTRNSARAATPKTQLPPSPSGTLPVRVDVGASGSGSIDCRDGQQWVSVVIWSENGFDATAVDPGTVTLYNGSADLGYGRDAGITTFAALTLPNVESQDGPVERARGVYTWRWRLEDVNRDGASDMVMEFRLDYTELTCNA